jgi:histidinol dehydrogenase
VRLVPSSLDRVGALVPRGIAAYPSTALMTGVPSQIAGVRELVVASPMPSDGSLDPALAYALELVDATTLYRAGGAAAVAALAYGTASLGRVDKIVGPGNAYAAAAKWLVSADVGIDALQGPSELIAVASGDADPSVLTLDLLAQAEHGAGAFAALVSDDADLLRAIVSGLAVQRRARVFLYRTKDLLAAVQAADDAAPEHVLLAGRGAAALSAHVRHAGGVFVGMRSAVAFGDYVAGTNHSLPTGGTARWASALRVDDFVRWTSRVSMRGDLRDLARAGAVIAGHEGMRFHKASMEARA